MITIQNDGQELLETNYWESEAAQKDYMFISFNARCMRLLVPDIRKHDLKDMTMAKKIIMERGKWEEQGNRDTILITFDDGSKLPYIAYIVVEQADVVPIETQAIIDFAVYTPAGLFKKWENCEYKKVETL
jgi:hypothetical protein